MHENVRSAFVRLDETETLVRIEPLYDAVGHDGVLSGRVDARAESRAKGAGRRIRDQH
jgi:hypothetical protein